VIVVTNSTGMNKRLITIRLKASRAMWLMARHLLVMIVGNDDVV
jgi:hypothetical protein